MGKVFSECVTKNKQRYYKVTLETGEEYFLPSVTTILGVLDKPALKQWAVNKCVDYIKDNLIKEAKGLSIDPKSNEVLQIIESSRKEHTNFQKGAMDIGTKVHNYIEKYNKANGDLYFDQQLELEDQRVKNGFYAFKKWADANDFKPIHSELLLYNPEVEYAGTADTVGMLNGKLYLIDFKTSNGFWSDYPLQLSAYGVAYNKLYPDNKISGIGVLRLDKDTGLPEWKDYSGGGSTYFAMFTALCQFYKLKKESQKLEGEYKRY